MNMLLIALIALIAGIRGAPQQPRASIEGVVVKLSAGEPLANASVQLNLETSQDLRSESAEPPGDERPKEDFHRTAKSDRDGRFVFENVAPGNYRLMATYEGGYVPRSMGSALRPDKGSNSKSPPVKR